MVTPGSVPFCEGGELSSANAAPEVIAATAIPIISRFKQMREISDIGGLYRRTLAEARPVAIKLAERLDGRCL
ncbi:hypothetical protein [Mesorhizobium sp.]|uniref:hypothetical protein n=1 Tax=Mesorhizobium sp. TaxID=1871066 RepID=UPI00257BE1F0|nr:hypothetical protein [Mesorhizobium sp.]